MKKSLIVGTAALLILSGCGRRETEVNSYRVAAVLPENGKIHATYYWQKVWEGVHEGADEQHFQLSEYQTNETSNTISDMLEVASEADVDGIIVNAGSAVNSRLLQVREKGCKVVVIDSDIGEEYYDLFVGINNSAASWQLADYLIQNYESGELLLLHVNASKAVHERYEAFERALEEAGLSEKVVELELRNENEERIEDIQHVLENNREIRWIVSFDPSCTLQAAESIERLRLSNSIFLVGFGESDIARNYMQDGTIDALLRQDNVQLGKKAVELIGSLIDGEKPSKKQVYIDTELQTVQEGN